MKQAKPSQGYENWIVWYRNSSPDDTYFLVFEKNIDGTVTHWVRNMGETGTLKPEVLAQCKPVTRKKEREWVDHTKKMIQRGIELTDIQYQLMKRMRDIGKEQQ